MLTFVTWKWPPRQHYRSQFPPETVNTLARMVRRHYDGPHRFLCVTDEREGLDASIEVIPAWNDYADLPSPHGGWKNPSCYRRLRAFDPEIGTVFGERFVSMDLDLVITGALRPLFDRPEDFVMYGDTNPRTPYNGSLFLMTAGARPHVWTNFDPKTSPRRSMQAGYWGSDQGWISYCLGWKEAKWTKKDGVYSFRNELQRTPTLQPDARVVVFHGAHDPWSPFVQARYPWVKEHWH